MKRISSPYSSSFNLFPFVFFGLLAFFFWLLLINGAYQKSPVLLVMVAIIGVGGFYFTKTSLRNLADEVYDCGDCLLVKKRGEQDRVPLSNITSVKFSTDARGVPARITLKLAEPGMFGTEISFASPPRIYLSYPRRNEVAEDLAARVERARTTHLAK
jgi:hypothetical protein